MQVSDAYRPLAIRSEIPLAIRSRLFTPPRYTGSLPGIPSLIILNSRSQTPCTRHPAYSQVRLSLASFPLRNFPQPEIAQINHRGLPPHPLPMPKMRVLVPRSSLRRTAQTARAAKTYELGSQVNGWRVIGNPD